MSWLSLLPTLLAIILNLLQPVSTFPRIWDENYAWVALYGPDDSRCEGLYGVAEDKSYNSRPKLDTETLGQRDWSPAKIIGEPSYPVYYVGINWGHGQADNFMQAQIGFWAGKKCNDSYLGNYERPKDWEYTAKGVKTCLKFNATDKYGNLYDARSIECIRGQNILDIPADKGPIEIVSTADCIHPKDPDKWIC